MPPGSRANVKLLRDGKLLDVVVVLTPLDEAVAAHRWRAARRSRPRAPTSMRSAWWSVRARLRRPHASSGLEPGEGVRISRVASLAARQAGLDAG